MTTRTWSFFRAGGVDQVKLNTGADLAALHQLDQKLWVSLACPAKGIEFDARTLELMDGDKDGRIRAPELVAAVQWAASVLKSVDELTKGASELPLTAIREDHDEGRHLAQAARRVLEGAGKAGAAALSVVDASSGVKAFDALPFNGDGAVPAESLTDADARKAAEDLLACVGGTPDRSGKTGFNAAGVEGFFGDVTAHLGWLKKAEGSSDVLPLKDATAAAYAAYAAVKTKVDDYFARCRVAAFDARALAAVQRDEKEFLSLAAKEISLSAAEFKEFPLAHVGAQKPLPLKTGLNPAWAGAVATFAASAVTPLVGERAELTEAEWLKLGARLDAYAAWQAEKAGVRVEKLGPARLKELATGKHREALEKALAQEKEQEVVANALVNLEKLVRYNRDLLALANNFVSFRNFYTRAGMATFQAGTLFLDQRSVDLCLRVEDAGKHAALAPLSGCYLAYCDCTRPASGEKMTIVAAFTNGDSDNLMVGRNGLFYDRAGKDWDATITKIVDNPISIRQAFFTPYKKLLRFVEDQINKRAAAADAANTDKLTTVASDVAAADAAKPPPEPHKKFDVGTIAALGVAVGGITAALGGILGALFGLGIWMPLGVGGVLLGISLPSMAIAYLKLRRRNLAPLLDANGWAINARALLNVPLGRSLTRLAVLPPGSSRDVSDPFAEQKRPWRTLTVAALFLLLVVGWYVGKLDAYLPGPAKSVTVLGSLAPAAPVAPVAPAAAPAAAPAPPAK